jgi:hypothetical protein
MQFKYVKTAWSTFWILGALAVGLAGGFTSLASWTLLGLCALVPMYAALRLWNGPQPSMSEAIHEALR